MARALLMACQDYFNIFLLVECIENLQDDSTGKRKDSLDSFPLQAFDEDFSTGEFHNNPPYDCMIRSAVNNQISKGHVRRRTHHHAEISLKSRGKIRDPSIPIKTRQYNAT